MQVTCENCGTAYKVEERLLGAKGRTVRCTQCHNMWHAEPPPREEEPAPPPVEIDLDWTKAPQVEAPTESEFHALVKADIVGAGDMPVPTDPLPADFEIPVMTYRPLGMGAGQFGAFVFLALLFTALLGLFIFKAPVTTHFPSMAYFYGKLGFSVKAPGEGFQLSEMVVENRVDGIKRSLSVQAKLANTTAHEVETPVLNIRLLGNYGSALKTWQYTPEKQEALAAGETIPLEMTFNDAPEDGKSVEVTISEE
ncbi:MAG TPA: zinc-ribbon domain-containing protein [Patescibacteria group bacterium]|nr:zinc-ribbon domain-containing protein [Patescibacteria group bacterium]